MIEDVSPFVRRRQEADLVGFLRECVNGVSGSALVTGAVGSGKSTIARRTTERLRSDGLVVLAAGGRRGERSRPFATLIRLLAQLPHDGREIETPLSVESGRATLLAVAARCPLVLAVDDVHHADPGSLGVITRVLGDATVPIGVLLCGDVRMTTSVPRGPRSLQVQLQPFSEEEVSELVDRSDGRRRGRWFPRACHEIGSGNARLTTALIADGRRRPFPGRVALGQHYREALRHTLDRSPTTLGEVATALAVAGTDASPGLLSRLTGLDPAQLVWWADRLQEAGIRGHDRFRHPGIAELLLDWADQQDLVCLHRRAAEFLDETGGDPASVELHDDAARVLAERDPTDPRPVDDEPDATAPPDVNAAQRRQAERTFAAIVADGPSLAALARLEQLLHQLEPEPATIETIGNALSGIVYCDQPRRAQYWCDRVLERIAAPGSRLWAQVLTVRAEAALRQGHLGAALADADATLRCQSARATPPAPEALAAYVLAGTRLGCHDEVASKLRESAPVDALQARSALPYFYARGHHQNAVGAHAAALDDFLTCGELAEDRSYDQPSFVPWRSGAAEAFLALGDTDRARRLLEEQLALVGAGRSRGITARLLARTVDHDRRRALLEQAVEDLQRHPDRDELAQARQELDAIRHTPPRREQRPQPAAAVPALAIGAATAAVAVPWRGLGGLSDAERRVADLAVLGHTNRSISTELCITVSTVEQHLTRIYRKLGIRQRGQLRRYA